MDVISGLNKVVVHTDNVTGSGNVVITFGNSTLSSSVSGSVATFYIPSIPVPGRQTYTVSFGGKSKSFELGYGEVKEIWLDGQHDEVDEARLKECLDELADEIDKEISEKFDEKLPFSLGIDEDGNYGYRKEGADTVIPFRSFTRNKILNRIYSSNANSSSAFTKEVDIKALYPKLYKTFTSDNFFFTLTPGGGFSSSAQLGVLGGTVTYDASTGIAKCTGYYERYVSEAGGYAYRGMHTDVWLVF